MKEHQQLAYSGKINENASLRDTQALIINAKIDKVWSLLFDVANWGKWNDHISNVKVNEVAEGANFTWKINGSRLKSTISKINKQELITWTSSFKGLKGIQVWKLEETDGDQTIVTCQQSLQGFYTIFYGHQNLHNLLILWLTNLKSAAEKS